MDKASQALALEIPVGVRRTYAVLAGRGNAPLSSVHHRHKGRRPRAEYAESKQYLAPAEEKALAKHVLLMSRLGHPIRIKHIPLLAFSIARQRATNRATKPPGKNWPQAFRKRHPGLLAKTVRSIDWKRHPKNIYNKAENWFDIIRNVFEDPDVQLKNVYNMDETGVMLSMQGSAKVFIGKDDPGACRGASVKRTTITAIECISADGRSLLPLIIWPASTHRENWTNHSTPGWHYAHSENGYNDSKISLEWLKRVFDPQTREIANGKPRVLICDGFGTHFTPEILEFCFENRIIPCCLPSHSSHKLQPCDVSLFGPLKTAYREQIDLLNYAGFETVGKEDFTALYATAREKAFTKRNIKAGWKATGLVPFDPEKVLRTLPKPLTGVTIGEDSNVAGPSEDAQRTPVTPTTPLTTEGLASLRMMIAKDAEALDPASKHRLHRHLRKYESAAQMSFAERDLLVDQNRSLMEVGAKVKARRMTRARKLADGKVVSFEYLEEVRAELAAKEKAKADKKTQGRRRKRSSIEAGTGTGTLTPKQKTAKGSEVQENVPWRAPVAKMY